MQTKVNDNLFAGQSIYVGIDYHKKSWKVTILGDQYEHKTMSQNPSPEILANYLKRNFPGASYQAVYEAGFSGFESCRALNKLGVNCIVTMQRMFPPMKKRGYRRRIKLIAASLLDLFGIVS